MDDTYSCDDAYRDSWAYQMSKFRYNQSLSIKENMKLGEEVD